MISAHLGSQTRAISLSSRSNYKQHVGDIGGYCPDISQANGGQLGRLVILNTNSSNYTQNMCDIGRHCPDISQANGGEPGRVVI